MIKYLSFCIHGKLRLVRQHIHAFQEDLSLSLEALKQNTT